MEIHEIREEKGNEPLTPVNYVPTFKKTDKVKVLPSKLKYSSDLLKLKGIEVVIEKCLLSNLGDMLTEVVYLNDSVNTEETKLINNPYLASHFIKVGHD